MNLEKSYYKKVKYHQASGMECGENRNRNKGEGGKLTKCKLHLIKVVGNCFQGEYLSLAAITQYHSMVL